MERRLAILLAIVSCASASAGAPLPQIGIEADKFMADGREFKIWGFNLGNGLNLSDETLQQQADQLEFLGVNLLRLHTIDWTLWDEIGPSGESLAPGLLPVGNGRSDTRHLVNVDKFYHFLNKLREKSIYVAIALTVCSNYVPADADILTTNEADRTAWIAAINALNNSGPDLQLFKILPVIDERALALRKEWAANLLNLRNPQTGVKLSEDSQLAFLSTANECSCWSVFYRNCFHKNLPAYFLNKYKAKWNTWLAQKYGTDSHLAQAWYATGKKGLLPGESLAAGTVDLLPLDPLTLSTEEAAEKGYPAFSECRRADYVRFSFEMDAAHQRIMRDHYRQQGWTRPCLYSDAAMGINAETGQMWMASDLFPYVEEHPYDEANVDPFMWGKIRIPTYLGSAFLGPEGPDRPMWGSEFREGNGWISWTRVPGPLFVAAYYSLEGRDGLTWHVWTMNRNHLQTPEAVMMQNLSWCHCNWDIPWLFAYRAAGRLFKSCEIQPLARTDPARARFFDWNNPQINADFSNAQVTRVSGENRAILTVATKHFRAVTTPYPQTVQFSDLTINLTANTANVVIVEKISNDQYEVTAIGTSGSMVPGQSVHFDPLQYVSGSVTFKNRTIISIQHINHHGTVTETVPGSGSSMPFVSGVRLYRVNLQEVPANAHWSLKDDFSLAGPDNGAWAYGHGTGPADFNLGVTDANFGGWGYLHMYRGNHSYDGYPLPGVGTNTDSVPHDPFDAITLNPGEVCLVSAAEPQYKPMVRWTAPGTAAYSVNAVFQGARSSLYNADVYVYRNGTRLSPNPTRPSPAYLQTNQSYTYTNSSLALNAGDHLFFMAGTGVNWFEIHDWTKLDVTIDRQVVDVQGTVTLVGYIGSLENIKVNVTLTEQGEIVKSRWLALDAAGRFTVSLVPVGTYEVVVRAYASPGILRTVAVSATSTDLGTFALTAADANGDNYVGFEDFALLQNTYGQTGAKANPRAAVAASGGCGSLGILLMTVLGLAGWGLGLENTRRT